MWLDRTPLIRISASPSWPRSVIVEISENPQGDCYVSMKFMNGTQDIESCHLKMFYNDRITLNSFIKELAVSTAFCGFGPMGVFNPVDYDQLHGRLVFIDASCNQTVPRKCSASSVLPYTGWAMCPIARRLRGNYDSYSGFVRVPDVLDGVFSH